MRYLRCQASYSPCTLIDHPVLIFITILVLSAACAWYMLHRRLSVDVANTRSSHTGEIPTSGGIGIVLTSTFCLGYLVYANHSLAHLGTLAGLVLVAGISLLDDIRPLSPRRRFAFQVLAAACVLTALIYVNPGQWTWTIGLIVMVWIVGMTNTFNFMDGLDGFAASTAFVAAIFYALLGHQIGIDPAFWVGITIAAGCAGFLMFNWPPARIFMGDVGSTSLGFLFAAAAVIHVDAIPVFVVPMLLLHFIVDAAFTFFRRLVTGKRVTQAHRTHAYQLLNRCGWTHAQVTMLGIMLGIVQGIAAVAMLLLDQSVQIWIMLTFVTIYVALATLVNLHAKSIRLLDS